MRRIFAIFGKISGSDRKTTSYNEPTNAIQGFKHFQFSGAFKMWCHKTPFQNRFLVSKQHSLACLLLSHIAFSHVYFSDSVAGASAYLLMNYVKIRGNYQCEKKNVYANQKLLHAKTKSFIILAELRRSV